MNDDIIIRKAILEDIDEICTLHVNSWNRTYKGIIDQEYLDNMKNNIEKRIERMKREFGLRNIIVATLNNEIVGFSEYISSNEFSKELDIDCELCGLYVKNEYIKTGVGTKLFNYVKDKFKDENRKKMGLWCSKENINVINFYINKGGILSNEKTFNLAGKDYNEVAFIYDLK